MNTLQTTFLGILIVVVLGLAMSIVMPNAALAQAAPAENSSGRTLSSSDGCNSWSLSGWSPTCLWQSFMSMLGSTLLSLAGGILVIAGFIFDQFLRYLVIDFQDTITTLNILPGIQVAWQLFRDLANVGIIGVFVFVAIMTILGSAEYGAKRLVARVLLVAILINFSLLFTRMIVEGTNFVAGQFARSMPGNAQEIGVAQSFLLAFGIDGVWSGTEALTDRVAEETDSGWAALLYGIVGGAALLAISGVLLYGAVIIAARALLLVFMLITSSLAFASFLLPQWSNQSFIGWNNWWSNLLKAAMFGPILMIFLWIAMQIVSRGNVSGAGDALGKIANDPTTLDLTAWQQIIFLIIGTGILFMGIRAASSFSSSIAVMSASRGLAGWASLLPIGLGARLGGLIGQQTIGRASLLASQRMLEAAKTQAARENKTSARLYDFGSRQFMQAASRNFNALNNSLGKQLAKGVTLRDNSALVGKNLKGFAGSQAKKVDKTAELAERMKLTDAEALKQAIRENPTLGAKHEETRQVVGSSKDDLSKLVQEQTKAVASFEKNIQSLNTELKRVQDAGGGVESQNKARELERKIESERTSHRVAMDEQTNRIAEAREKLIAAETNHKNVVGKLEGRAPQQLSAKDLGRAFAQSGFTSALERATGMGSLVDRRGEAVEKQVGDNITNKRLRDALAPVIESHQAASSPVSPPAPVSPPPQQSPPQNGSHGQIDNAA